MSQSEKWARGFAVSVLLALAGPMFVAYYIWWGWAGVGVLCGLYVLQAAYAVCRSFLAYKAEEGA